MVGRIFYGTTDKERINAHTGSGYFGDDVYHYRYVAFAAGISHVPDGSGRAGGKRCDHCDLHHRGIFRRFSDGEKDRREKIFVGTAHGGALLRSPDPGWCGSASGIGCGTGASALNDGVVSAVGDRRRNAQLKNNS